MWLNKKNITWETTKLTKGKKIIVRSQSIIGRTWQTRIEIKDKILLKLNKKIKSY